MGGIDRIEDIASGLSASLPARSSRIAILVDYLGTSYSEPIFSELTETAREHGVSVVWLVGNLSHDDLVGPQRNFISGLATRDSVDGVLVVQLGNTISVGELTEYCARYRPLPLSSIAVPWKAFPHVAVDNEPGMRAALRHLLSTHGYRRIAFVRGPEMSEEADLRYRVYREVLAESGIAFDPDLVAPGFFIPESGIEAVRLFLDEREVVFDAVACANDGTAMGVIEALTARGIEVPQKVAVIGFDDAEGCRFTEPPLTTVRQPVREQARAAFQLLLSQIFGRQLSGPVRLETELVVRESCGCSPYAVPADASSPVAGPGDAGVASRRLFATGEIAAPDVVAAMGEVRLPRSSSAPQLEDVCLAFASDIAKGGISFLRSLEAALQAASRTNNGFDDFHKLVSVLEQRMAGWLAESTPRARRIDGLLDAARVLVGGLAERGPVVLQHRYEDFSEKLLGANQSIMAAGDLAALTAALARHLPGFGVPSCHICLYEGDAVPAEWSRVVVSWSADRVLELPPGGLRFRSRSWLPAVLAVPQRWSAHIAYPIDSDGRSLGYVALEHGPAEGHAYERLARQIDAAFQRILMREQLVEQARRRQAADRERLEKEVRVARRIETGLAPRQLAAEGLEMSAFPPDPGKSGDYYDVIPTADGCFIGIGSLEGEGLARGLAMLMVQSVVSGLTRRTPAREPSAILAVAETVLADNLGRRGAGERVGLTLARYHASGRLVVSGKRGALVIRRAAGGVERWDASRAGEADASYDLAIGDSFTLYPIPGSPETGLLAATYVGSAREVP